MDDLLGLVLSYLVLVIFTVAHVASKWQDHRESIQKISLFDYVYYHAPAKTLVAGLSSIGLGIILLWMDSMNPLTALTAGWSANSIVDHLAKRGQTLIQ